MTDQPTEGWLSTKCTVCGGTRRRPLAPMPGVRHVAAPVTPCSCRTGFFVHKGVPAVSVVESDRRRDAAVQAERDRCTAWVAAAPLSVHGGYLPTPTETKKWVAAGIESGEPA